MSNQDIPTILTNSGCSDIQKIESPRCILGDKTFLYQGGNIPNEDVFITIFDPFTTKESSIKSGDGDVLQSISKAPEFTDSQTLSKLMKIHCKINHASVECNKDISYRYSPEGNGKNEIDQENINPYGSSDSVMDTKEKLKRLERKITGKARQADCESGSDIYDDSKIPAKRAALCLKLRQKEPTKITSSSVNFEITSAFLQNPTSNDGLNATFPALQEQLDKNVGQGLPIALVNMLDSTSQMSCQMIQSEDIGKCETLLTTPMTKEFDIKCKYSNELIGTQIQIPISTMNQLLSGTVITVSNSNSGEENLTLESASSSSQIERASCSTNDVRYDNCQVATLPKTNQCLYEKLTKIPVDIKSDKFNREGTKTAARLEFNPSKIISNREISFPDKRKCDDAIENSVSREKKQKIEIDFPSEDLLNLCTECHCPPIDGDIFLCCSKCNAKAHSSCLRYSSELSEIFKDKPWECLKCEGEFNLKNLPCNENMDVCDLCGRKDSSMFRSPECEMLKCPESYRLCRHCFLEYIQFQLQELMDKNKTFEGNIKNENSIEKSAVKESYL